MDTLKGHDDFVWSLAFSPDGTRILSGSFDGTIRLWEVASGKPLATWKAHNSGWSVAFSPDGTRLLSCGEDQTVEIPDAETGVALKSLRGHHDTVYSAVFAPDGQWIASGSKDGEG